MLYLKDLNYKTRNYKTPRYKTYISLDFVTDKKKWRKKYQLWKVRVKIILFHRYSTHVQETPRESAEQTKPITDFGKGKLQYECETTYFFAKSVTNKIE